MRSLAWKNNFSFLRRMTRKFYKNPRTRAKLYGIWLKKNRYL